MRNNWSDSIPADDAYRRAGGRRRYNAQRRRARDERRRRVFALLAEYGHGRGAQARIARELGVSRATISRDVVAVYAFYYRVMAAWSKYA